MAKHALLSPSAASRWMICHGSIALTKDMPRKSNAAADYGTMCHAYCEKLLKGKSVIIDDEDTIKLVNAYVDTAKQYITPGDVVCVEESLPISSITGEDDAYGTADLVVIGEHLIVIDAKFGSGRVDVQNNRQLMIYALAAAKKYSYSGKVLTVIVQPKINYVGEHWYEMDELEQFAKDIKQASFAALAMATGEISPSYVPDPAACKWCIGKAYCPALAEKMFDVMDNDKPLHELAAWTETARKWADDIDDRVLETLQDGKDVPGWQLSTGRQGNRKWIDEAKAIEALGDHAFVQTLISPTKAEKILPKAALEHLVFREPGKPIAKKVQI